ncbi:hypothetical protein KR018_001469 [Drosophila ironensis]|nr:hypothetical protein KR018_001469 [Drosophila ironensis]
MPRSRSMAMPEQRRNKHSAECSSQDDEESIDNDMVVMPVPRLTSQSQEKWLALAKDAGSNNLMSSKRMDEYLSEQRDNTRVVEQKLDALMKAMDSLSTSTMQPLAGGAAGGARLADNEEQVLALEQQLLKFRIENRSLLQSLQAREDAFHKLRTSTCSLYQELIQQNSELKDQNAVLLKTISGKCTANCDNCRGTKAALDDLRAQVKELQATVHSYRERSNRNASYGERL